MIVSPGDNDIEQRIRLVRRELHELDSRRSKLSQKLSKLEKMRGESDDFPSQTTPLNSTITTQSHNSDKITLFRSLFKGREDVYPKRFESLKTGRSGYQPACGNEWIPRICEKPKIKCGDCENRDFLPITDDVILNHLLGYNPDDAAQRDFSLTYSSATKAPRHKVFNFNSLLILKPKFVSQHMLRVSCY